MLLRELKNPSSYEIRIIPHEDLVRKHVQRFGSIWFPVEIAT